MGFDVFLAPNSHVVVFYMDFDVVLPKLSCVTWVLCLFGFKFAGSCILRGF